MGRHVRVLQLLALATLLLPALGSSAQEQYPSRPIHLIVGFPAGGPTDVSARFVAEKLHDRLGQPVIVENRGGAASNIAAATVAKAPADGYTLLLATSSNVVNPSLYANAGYDPVKDFAPISLLTKIPSLLVVRIDSPAKSVADLVALVKANPGQLNYSSGGSGSMGHLSGAMFQSAAKLDVVHVPYKGAPEIVSSLLAGQVQFAFPGFSAALPQVKAGKLRALAVTGEKRNPQLPDVPTIQEAMSPGFVVEVWFGLWAPAGTPPAIVTKLSEAVKAVLASPDSQAKLSADGSEVLSASPEEFAAYVKDEVAKWGRIVKQSGARVE
jgi:tripartite-type tricarboxylate transporter receptor subunit TctC